MQMATALLLKWSASWLVLLLFGLVAGPSSGQAVVIAAVLAVVSYWADRLLPFGLQGITRWAIDSGLAAFTIFFSQYLWPGAGMSLFHSVFAGFVIGAVEIPLHFFLAARFGLRRTNTDTDGID